MKNKKTTIKVEVELPYTYTKSKLLEALEDVPDRATINIKSISNPQSDKDYTVLIASWGV